MFWGSLFLSSAVWLLWDFRHVLVGCPCKGTCALSHCLVAVLY